MSRSAKLGKTATNGPGPHAAGHLGVMAGGPYDVDSMPFSSAVP